MKGKITFEHDSETGLLKAYKDGRECGTITTMGDLITKENMEKRDAEIQRVKQEKKDIG